MTTDQSVKVVTTAQETAEQVDIKSYALVTVAYWGFTLTDGALRMLVLLYFHELGYSPIEVALLFVLYEIAGVVTNLIGGWLGARFGLKLPRGESPRAKRGLPASIESWERKSGYQQDKPFAQLYHETQIINYFYWPLTHGFTEGKNNILGVVKRRAYGFRNFSNLRHRIFLEGTRLVITT